MPVTFQPDEDIQIVQVAIVDSSTAEFMEVFFGRLQEETGELVEVINDTATVNIINGKYYFQVY